MLAAPMQLAQQAGGQPDDLAVVDLPDQVGELAGHEPGVVEVGDDLVDEHARARPA